MKILIVKIGALGDVVMALAMVEAIDRLFPGAHITWVCGKSVVPLLKANQRINEIIPVDDRKLFRGGLGGALSELIPLWFKLLGKRFDLVVTGHSDSRYQLLSLTVWARIRRQFGDFKTGRWPVPGRYHAHEYVRLITGQNDSEAVSATVPILTLSLRPPLSQKIKSENKTIALAPGGAKNLLRDDALRRWPLENYIQLAQKLIKNGHQVIITGSASDEWIQDSFKKLSVVDLVGQTSIEDLIAVFANSNVVITHDSGPFHLAVVSGKPVIGLFGPTNPWEKAPRNEKIKIIWGGEALACRPCYDGKNYADCKNNLCLKQVSANEVYGEVEKMLLQR